MHLLTIESAEIIDKEGRVLWRVENLKNTLHTQGEEFILKSVFARSSNVTIPTTYYVGLDSRTTINKGDTLDALVGEPTTNGYHRFALSAQSGMSAVYDSVKWKVKTTSILFSAVGGSWGPVKNAFLATGTSNQGYLISTVSFPTAKTVNNGESYSFKLSLGIGG